MRKKFVYKEGSLAGAKFKVYAAEDIYTADNQKDADGNRIEVLQQGRPCGNSYNRKRWKGSSKEFSSWTVQDGKVEAPYGYVLNPDEQKVTL